MRGNLPLDNPKKKKKPAEAAEAAAVPVEPVELVENPDELLEENSESGGLLAVQFSGPIPPPSVLRGYEEVCPGAAQDIINMAKKEQDHRHDRERGGQEAAIADTKRGQWLGLGIAVIVMLIAAAVTVFGQPLVGGLLGTLDLVALVTVFVLGDRLIENE